MSIDRIELLQKKLAENKNKILEKEKKKLADSVDDFDKKYRFADEAEIRKIEEFINKLESPLPGHIAACENSPAPHRNMYLCFLMGSEEQLKMYIYGGYEDLMNDMDEWNFISPYLLLIDEDFVHYIYINDHGEATESKID